MLSQRPEKNTIRFGVDWYSLANNRGLLTGYIIIYDIIPTHIYPLGPSSPSRGSIVRHSDHHRPPGAASSATRTISALQGRRRPPCTGTVSTPGPSLLRGRHRPLCTSKTPDHHYRLRAASSAPSLHPNIGIASKGLHQTKIEISALGRYVRSPSPLKFHHPVALLD